MKTLTTAELAMLDRIITDYGTLKTISKFAEERIDQLKSDVHDLLGVSKVYNLNEQQVEEFENIKLALPGGVVNYHLKETRSTDWDRLKEILTDKQWEEVRITNPHSELKITPKKG